MQRKELLAIERALTELPRWARVALAARCASKALVLRDSNRRRVSQADWEHAKEAVRYAWDAAAHADADVEEAHPYSPYSTS
jgi:hypothetical protein